MLALCLLALCQGEGVRSPPRRSFTSSLRRSIASGLRRSVSSFRASETRQAAKAERKRAKREEEAKREKAALRRDPKALARRLSQAVGDSWMLPLNLVAGLSALPSEQRTLLADGALMKQYPVVYKRLLADLLAADFQQEALAASASVEAAHGPNEEALFAASHPGYAEWRAQRDAPPSMPASLQPDLASVTYGPALQPVETILPTWPLEGVISKAGFERLYAQQGFHDDDPVRDEANRAYFTELLHDKDVRERLFDWDYDLGFDAAFDQAFATAAEDLETMEREEEEDSELSELDPEAVLHMLNTAPDDASESSSRINVLLDSKGAIRQEWLDLLTDLDPEPAVLSSVNSHGPVNPTLASLPPRSSASSLGSLPASPSSEASRGLNISEILAQFDKANEEDEKEFDTDNEEH